MHSSSSSLAQEQTKGRGRWGDWGGDGGTVGCEGAWDPGKGILTPCRRKAPLNREPKFVPFFSPTHGER